VAYAHIWTGVSLKLIRTLRSVSNGYFDIGQYACFGHGLAVVCIVWERIDLNRSGAHAY
jgi:hypothetical protein